MSDLAAGRSGATALRVMVGTRLRRYREAAGIPPERAADEIRASRSKLSRMENGRVGFKLRDVQDLLTLYGVTDEKAREEMLALARQGSTPSWWAAYNDVVTGWFEAYLGMEASASLIRAFDNQFVHGLFQTEDYARAVTVLGHRSAPAAEIDRRVNMRMKRQDLLWRPDAPPIWWVMDEAVLRRPVGGRDVMQAQLLRLVELAAMSHVTMQAVPFSRGGHAAAGGSFAVLRFAEPDVPDAVYIEHLTGALYLEKRADVEHYLEVMNMVSAQALNPTATMRFLKEIIRDF